MVGDVLLSAFEGDTVEAQEKEASSPRVQSRDEQARHRAGLNNMFSLLQVES